MLKKIARPFATESIARHAFREIIMLRHLKHENVRAPKTFTLSRSDGNRSSIWSISSFHLRKTCALFYIYDDELTPY
jgi:hypothetical protein